MWDLIEGLASGGTTVLMTTQYLEEADRLADDIAVIDHGRVIARGTALQLKQQVGGERLEITISDSPWLDAARRVLEALGEGPAHVDPEARHVSVAVTSHDGVLTRAIRELDAADVHVDDIGFRRPDPRRGVPVAHRPSGRGRRSRWRRERLRLVGARLLGDDQAQPRSHPAHARAAARRDPEPDHVRGPLHLRVRRCHRRRERRRRGCLLRQLPHGRDLRPDRRLRRRVTPACCSRTTCRRG